MGAASQQDGTVVLVADDEDLLRNLMQRILEREGYMVLTAYDGVDALGTSRGYAHAINLLIADMQMPGLSGAELASQILAERPQTRVLLISGTVSPPSTHWPFLWKPFAINEFLTKVKDVLDSPI